MRWYSWIAAGLLATALIFGIQPAANSATTGATVKGWQAEVTPKAGAAIKAVPDASGSLAAKLEPDDPLAVLEAVGYALNEVGDGATYVWHRTDGPLAGNVRMAKSYRGEVGAICRKLTVTLILGKAVRPASFTACRDAGGQWVLGG